MSMNLGADAGVRPGSVARARPNFPDVLDDLLSDHEDGVAPGLEDIDRLLASMAATARRQGPLPANRPAPAERPRLAVVAPAAPAKPRQTRRKTTQYLVEDVFARLEAARDALETLGAGSIRRVSKSGIVNAALSLALTELESRGEHSRLARTVLRGPKSGRKGKE